MAQINASESANAEVAKDGGRQPLLETLARDLEDNDATLVKSKQTLFASLGVDVITPPTPLPAPKGRIPKLPKATATITRADAEASTATDRRLEQLENLVASQAAQNESIMNMLGTLTQNAFLSRDHTGEGADDDEYYQYQDEEVEEDSHSVAPVTDEPTVTEEPAVSGFAEKFAASSYGKDIEPGMASSLRYLFTNRLTDKQLGDVCDLYDTPKNAKHLCVPKVNSQIWDSLRPQLRSNDIKLQKVENLMVKGITAFARTTDGLTSDQENGMTCLAAAVFELNMLRRDLLKPGLHEKFTPLCKPSIPVTENLFGDDLTRHIKDIDEAHKATGKMVRHPRFAPYNPRGKGRGSNQPFLARGPPQPRQQHRAYKGALPARRGRGRGAVRSQSQPQQ